MFCAYSLSLSLSFSFSLFMLCTNVSDKNQWQRLGATTELRFVFDWFEQIFGFWHTCHVLVPRGSCMPKSLPDILHSPAAFCWLQVHMPYRRCPKICKTHVRGRGRGRGWLKARTAELDEWADGRGWQAEAVKTFVPCAPLALVCRRQVTKWLPRRGCAPQISLSIGQLERQTRRPTFPSIRFSLCLGCALSQTSGAAHIVLQPRPCQPSAGLCIMNTHPALNSLTYAQLPLRVRAFE